MAPAGNSICKIHIKPGTLKIGKIILVVLVLCIAGTEFTFGRTVKKNDPLSYTDSKLHTVLFFTEGWEFSIPVLDPGSNARLLLKFDELSRDPRNYLYSIVHCDADWVPSRLVASEYMEGFAENPINDYAFSVNTTIPFINYRLLLPNDDVKILISGNYLLKVWDSSNKEKPVLIRPFFVTEKQVEISGEIRKATFEGYKGPGQQVAFAVDYPKFSITDPLNEIKATVWQNSRTDNRLNLSAPTFIRQKQLIYEDKANPFRGGNEFRNFNAKNLQTNGMGIQSVEYREPFFHIFLQKDYPLGRDIYRSQDDLNGGFLVKNDRASDADLESDYIYVHFSLTPPDLVTNDPVFVFGALSDWQCTPLNQMTYNAETKCYELSLLLKQGFYDYQYVLWNEESRTADATFFEGSHVDTENDYRFFIYYKGFSSRYDRLIGYRVLNSVHR